MADLEAALAALDPRPGDPDRYLSPDRLKEALRLLGQAAVEGSFPRVPSLADIPADAKPGQAWLVGDDLILHVVSDGQPERVLPWVPDLAGIPADAKPGQAWLVGDDLILHIIPDGGPSRALPWVPSEADLPDDALPGQAWLVGDDLVLFITPDPTEVEVEYATLADLQEAFATIGVGVTIEEVQVLVEGLIALGEHRHPINDVDGLKAALDALAQFDVDVAEAINTLDAQTQHNLEQVVLAFQTELDAKASDATVTALAATMTALSAAKADRSEVLRKVPGKLQWEASPNTYRELRLHTTMGGESPGARIKAQSPTSYSSRHLHIYDASDSYVGQILTTADLLELAETSLGSVGTAGPLIVHDSPPPSPTGDEFTPRELIALWDGYSDGLHLFEKYTLVHLRRMTAGANVQIDLEVTGPGFRASSTLRDWGDGESYYLGQSGSEFMLMRSPKGTVPFAPVPTISLDASRPASLVEARQIGAMAQAAMDFLTPGEWLPIGLTNGSQDTLSGLNTCLMRYNAGRIELKGQFAVPTSSGYRSPVFRITHAGYRPQGGTTQTVPVWEDKVAARMGYLSVSEDGTASIQGSGGNWNRVSLDGISWPAAAGQQPSISGGGA